MLYGERIDAHCQNRIKHKHIQILSECKAEILKCYSLWQVLIALGFREMKGKQSYTVIKGVTVAESNDLLEDDCCLPDPFTLLN